MWKCELCETLNENGTEYCSVCAAKKASTGAITAETGSGEAKKNDISWAQRMKNKARGMFSRSSKKKTADGALSLPANESAAGLICKTCGSPLNGEDVTCAVCGMPFYPDPVHEAEPISSPPEYSSPEPIIEPIPEEEPLPSPPYAEPIREMIPEEESPPTAPPVYSPAESEKEMTPTIKTTIKPKTISAEDEIKPETLDGIKKQFKKPDELD